MLDSGLWILDYGSLELNFDFGIWILDHPCSI